MVFAMHTILIILLRIFALASGGLSCCNWLSLVLVNENRPDSELLYFARDQSLRFN